jgi:hypothetical protein
LTSIRLPLYLDLGDGELGNAVVSKEEDKHAVVA